MMNHALVIARLTWAENVRRKVFYFLFFLTLLFLAGGRVLNVFGMAINSRLLKDFGLSGISLFALLFTFALFLQALSREIEQKTIYPILAKPISRLEYLWGKFLGNMAVLGVFVLVLAVTLELMLFTLVKAWFPMVFSAVLLVYLECGVLGALMLLFSVYLSYPVNLSLTLLIYIIGNLSSAYIKMVIDKGNDPVLRFLVETIKPWFPQFELFHIKNAVVHDYILAPQYLPLAVLYGLFYIILLMQIAGICFKKKEL